MKVAIDAICAENRSGTGRYTSELLRAFQATDADIRFAVRVNQDSPFISVLGNDKRFEISVVKRRPTALRVISQNLATKRWLTESRADVLHGPAFVLPPKCPVPSVVTVHDLVFRLFPETIPFIRRHYYRRAFSRSIREANLVLCDSENTRRDLMEIYKVDPGKTQTIHLGVDPRFFDDPSAEAMESTRKKYQLPERFYLTLGTLEPRKNLPRVIRAYADARSKSDAMPPLVIAGRTGWGTKSIDALISDPALKPHIILPGFIDDADLPVMYRLCDLFLHLSLYEGFGLPLLEAMASGAMVLAGNNSSQSEILNEGRFLLDSSDEKCICQALLDSGQLADEKETIAERNRARARHFSWAKTASETLKAYQDAVDKKTVSRS